VDRIARLDIPVVLPSPYDGFREDWQEQMSTIRGKVCRVIDQRRVSSNVGPIEGWQVDYVDFFAWVPSCWVTFLTTESYCNSCGGTGKHRTLCPVLKAIPPAEE
jgi:hypothetical protein